MCNICKKKNVENLVGNQMDRIFFRNVYYMWKFWVTFRGNPLFLFRTECWNIPFHLSLFFSQILSSIKGNSIQYSWFATNSWRSKKTMAWRPCWMTKQNVLSSNMAATSLSFGSPGIGCKPRIPLLLLQQW